MIIILPRSLTLALRPLRLSDLEDVSRLIRASLSSHRHCSPLPVYSASCVYPPCLTLCSLYRVGADMRGEQAERRLPPSRPYSVPRVLTSQVLARKTSPLLRRHCATRPSEVAKCGTRERLLGFFGVSGANCSVTSGKFLVFPKGEENKNK